MIATVSESIGFFWPEASMGNVSHMTKATSFVSGSSDRQEFAIAITEEQVCMGIKVTEEILANPRYKKELDMAIVEIQQGKVIARNRKS